MAYNNVEKLLRECTNPVNYNFEYECDYEDYKAMSPLERFLVYKSTYEGQEISNKYVHQHEDVQYYYRAALFSLDNYWRYPNLVDCDGWNGECSLAIDLYRTLWNWKPYGAKHWEGLGSFGGDTFNSVQTTLNQYLEFMLGDNEEYRQYMEGKNPRASIMFYLQLYCIYGMDFIKHFEKKTELIQFIKLCHTLGNLGVVPALYNGHRGSQSFIKDYSDLSLDNLKYSRDSRNFLGENDKIRKRNFRKYINTLFLWDYADKNYDAVPLCESHRKKLEMYRHQNPEPDAKFVLPEKEEIDDLCRNINNRIKRRGIFMTAMLRIALGICSDGTAEILKYTYDGKYGKWADWKVSGIYKKLMEDVFMTDKVYSGGYKEVVEVIKDRIAGNPDEGFVNDILSWMVSCMNLRGDEIRDEIDSDERANQNAGFISKEELPAIVEDAIEGDKRFEQFSESLKSDPEVRAQWEAKKKGFLNIDIS